MKKILIIEDTKEAFDNFKKLFSTESYVDFSLDISPIYDNDKKSFIEVKEYEFVLVHNSFFQENISTEIISELKEFVIESSPYRLITYSGGNSISQNITNINQRLIYLQRKIINENISQFVDFSKKIDEWYLPALLYKDYTQRYLKSSYYNLRKSFDYILASKCLEILGYSNIVITDDNKEEILNQIIIKADA